MPSISSDALARLAAALEEEPAARRKTCPACGASFSCLPGACWCAALRLSATTLRELRAKYDNCLCPACLLPLAQ
jgi:hypothetical protein